MNLPIRFASINIEHNKHYARVLPFLGGYRPDVLCLQEFHECDREMFEQELKMRSVFAPMIEIGKDLNNPKSPLTKAGVAIFSKFPIKSWVANYYVGDSENLPKYRKEIVNGVSVMVSPIHKVLLSATIDVDGNLYTFATTHFTWTMNGEVSEEQRRDLKNLMMILEKMPNFVLSGDFNAPRGRKIWNTIARRYKDNIPPHYTTSIDKNLHRAGDLRLLVDGLFTTPEYTAADAKLSDGVSDHMAITANVFKK